jgi:hypothetical protein
MENWHRLIFLKTLARIPASARLLLGVFVISIASLPAYAADDEVDDELGDFEEVGLIPEVERREIKISDIDTENFEIGIAAGLMSVEDFETNPLVVGSFTYMSPKTSLWKHGWGKQRWGKQASINSPGGQACFLLMTVNCNFMISHWA